MTKPKLKRKIENNIFFNHYKNKVMKKQYDLHCNTAFEEIIAIHVLSNYL